MAGGFKDHFSGHAADYARARPGYPEALFDFLASLPWERGAAWDCGTGSGQAAAPLARRFARVVASDASAAQIARAPRAANVLFLAAPAERPPLPDASIDLITVAQALHWFDFAPFFAEVRRVARPGAAFAAWAYGNCRVSPEVDALYDHLYEQVLGPYWPPERAHVEQGYRTIPSPFAAMPAPSFVMDVHWDLAGFLGYVETWSATQRYRRQTGQDPLAPLRPALESAWGDPAAPRRIVWPLALLVARPRP
ncbi:MAG TPA: class I SAM-dependent methyltransferase [Polyangia bacterium]|jgi:SAM-dependent methyltransferase|nr:class I SAM-dependent methyltransferase [Polyangia bacterium]